MQIIHRVGLQGAMSRTAMVFGKGLCLQKSEAKIRFSVSVLEMEKVSHLGGMGVIQRL